VAHFVTEIKQELPMTITTHPRTFIKAVTSGVVTSLLKVSPVNARPLSLPIGLQLYTVGHEMDSDPAGTLKAVVAAGYQQVELSPLSKTPPKDLKKMLEDVVAPL
jgi:hypothetical protein